MTAAAPTNPTTPALRQRKSGTSPINIALTLALMVAIGGIAFGIGHITAPASAAAGSGGFARGGFTPGATGATGAAGTTGGRFGGASAATIQGTVTDVTASGVTITTAAGLTVQVATDGTTTYHQQAAGTSSNVAVGKTVLVQLAGFGGRAPGTSGATGATGAAPGAAGSSAGTARDITVIGQ
jgi:hypothetical protein